MAATLVSAGARFSTVEGSEPIGRVERSDWAVLWALRALLINSGQVERHRIPSRTVYNATSLISDRQCEFVVCLRRRSYRLVVLLKGTDSSVIHAAGRYCMVPFIFSCSNYPVDWARLLTQNSPLCLPQLLPSHSP